MKSNCYPKYAVGFVSVKTFCVWGILFAFRNVIFFDVNKQRFKYSVNSAILFSKSFWTSFTRVTSWHILCFAWCRSYPKRLELQVPPNWDFGGWIALSCEMHIFQRCGHRQTDLVTTGPFQKNFGLKWLINCARTNFLKWGEVSVTCTQNLAWVI